MPCECNPTANHITREETGEKIRECFGNTHLLKVECPRCEQKWIEHDIAKNGRLLITADWEPKGWNMFVWDSQRADGYYPIQPPGCNPLLYPTTKDLEKICKEEGLKTRKISLAGLRKKINEDNIVGNIDLIELEFDELTASGNWNLNLTITAPFSSEQAIQKVEDAGGEVVRYDSDAAARHLLKSQNIDIPIERAVPPRGESLHPSVERGYYIQDVSRFFFKEQWFIDQIRATEHGVDLIIETAHFRRRTETSKSQVFTLSQLEELFEFASDKENKIRIFEFPASIQKRVHIECGTDPKKDKERDPENIAVFVTNRPYIPLRRFNPATWRNFLGEPRDDQEELERKTKLFLRSIRKDCTYRLNVLRAPEPPYVLPEEADGLELEPFFNQVDHAIQLIESHFPELDDDSKKILSEEFNIEYYPSLGDLAKLYDENDLPKNTISLSGLDQIIVEGQGSINLLDHEFHNLSASGNIDSPIIVQVHEASEKAIEAIEQAGGSVEFIDKLEFYRRSFDEAGIDFPETSENISKVGTEYPKLNSIMAVYSTVVEFNDAGEPVLRRNPESNRFVGVDFIWSRVLTMSPYHGAFGGVARANLMMYGLQATHESGANSVRYQPISQGENGIQEMYERQKKRRAWRKAVKLLIRLFRDSMYAEEKNRTT